MEYINHKSVKTHVNIFFSNNRHIRYNNLLSCLSKPMYTLCGGDVTEKYKNEQLHCYGMINITVLLPVQLHY